MSSSLTACVVRRWWPFAIAVVVHVVAGASPARAQTVIVTEAPPGATVELVVNGTEAASVMAGANGRAVLQSDAFQRDTPSIEALIWLDLCGDVRRVQIAAVTLPPPPAEACARTPIEGRYRVQRETSIVIDVGGSLPTLLIRQGPVPEAWLTAPAGGDFAVAGRRVPRGLVLSGGGGFGRFRDFVAPACGNVRPCVDDGSPLVGSAAATFWFLPYAGVEAGFIRPGSIHAEGRGADFDFESEQDGGLLTLMGTGGLPLGPVRLFGAFGANYHRATLTMTQTFGERTIMVDGSPVVLPAATQTLQSRTEGFGWIFKAGGEWWLTSYLGIYGEGGQLRMKGDSTRNDEVRVDDKLTFVLVGVRLRVPGL